MSVGIKINDAIIAKCALDNPDLPLEFIRDILVEKYTDSLLAEPFSFAGNKVIAI